MQSQRKKHDDKGNSWIGWLIFVLIIAGGPILNTIQSMLGPGVRLPSYLLPLIVGALVIISAAISIMRAVGGGRGDQSAFPPSTPMSQSAPARPTMRERPMSYPMPPIGGDMGMPTWPTTTGMPSIDLPPPAELPTGREKLPRAPGFEPIISGRLVVVGIAGLLTLAAAAAVVFGTTP